MKLWKLLLLLALAVAVPGFSYSQEPSKRPAVYEFDLNSAGSMRGYMELIGYKFFGIAPEQILDEARETCGEDGFYVGTALHPDYKDEFFSFCQRRLEVVTPTLAIAMCGLLSMARKEKLPVLDIKGTKIYCGVGKSA